MTKKHNTQKSPKEYSLDKKILSLVSGRLKEFVRTLLADEEIHHLQEYANIVSIMRLGYNDHGPVHMRKVVANSLVIADLLHKSGVSLCLEKEEVGTYEDSLTAIILGGFLHDIGMSVTREDHENYSTILAEPIVRRMLGNLYGDDLRKRTFVGALVMECITGHMGRIKINSLEAGIILIADGCDMEKGRARIPMLLAKDAKVGDIHKYSSAAVESIHIERGEKLPVRITVLMSKSVGFFQVEEVLFPKLNSSPVKPYIELYAGVVGEELKCYL